MLPCNECGDHIDENFDETLSDSFRTVPCGECQSGQCSRSQCHLSTHYLDGSAFQAYEAQDVAYIGGPHDRPLLRDNDGVQDIDPNHPKAFAFRMTFGCETSNANLFKTQLADGIMGMDKAELSFWSQMYNADLMGSKSFSLCFTRQPVADKEGTEAGAMTLGGYDDRLHDTPMVYTTSPSSGGQYFGVHVRKIHLRHGSGGDRSATADMDAEIITLSTSETQLNTGNVIVDSGTTDTYFTSSITKEFNNAYEKQTGKTFDHIGVDLSLEELNSLPTILIQMAGDETKNEKKGKCNRSCFSTRSRSPARPSFSHSSITLHGV